MISSTSERRIRRFIESRSYSYSGFDSSDQLLADLISFDQAERRRGEPVPPSDLARVIVSVTPQFDHAQSDPLARAFGEAIHVDGQRIQTACSATSPPSQRVQGT